MKEFLSALLAVLLLISVLVACDSHKDVDDAGSGSVSSENKEKDTTTEAPAEAYKNITCRNIRDCISARTEKTTCCGFRCRKSGALRA